MKKKTGKKWGNATSTIFTWRWLGYRARNHVDLSDVRAGCSSAN